MAENLKETANASALNYSSDSSPKSSFSQLIGRPSEISTVVQGPVPPPTTPSTANSVNSSKEENKTATTVTLLAGSKRSFPETLEKDLKKASNFVKYSSIKGEGRPQPKADPGVHIQQLFKEISDNIEASRIDEMRRNFLRGFIGQKVLDPLPKCPIESMFWDWMFSYYPDNEGSIVRFTNFSREYLSFVLDNKRFASNFLEWIQVNETNLLGFADNPGKNKITQFDIKLYADIFKRIIKENLSYGTEKKSYQEYANATINGKAPTIQDELLVQHVCGTMCSSYAISHLITFKHREFLRNNFTRIFADRVINKKIFTSLSVVAKPDPKMSISPVLSQIKLTASKKAEEIIKENTCKCDQCKETVSFLQKDIVDKVNELISQSVDKIYEAYIKTSNGGTSTTTVAQSK